MINKINYYFIMDVNDCNNIDLLSFCEAYDIFPELKSASISPTI